MLRSKLLASLCIGILLFCGFRANALEETPELYTTLLEYPEFKNVMLDEKLGSDFHRFVYELPVPDLKYLQTVIESDTKNIVDYMLIFHEEVEFRGWLRLGHSVDDIVRMDYFGEHYPEVFPAAHSEAVRQELALISHYTKSLGSEPLPANAFALIHPIIDMNEIGE